LRVETKNKLRVSHAMQGQCEDKLNWVDIS
jgi:hypothetical protein